MPAANELGKLNLAAGYKTNVIPWSYAEACCGMPFLATATRPQDTSAGILSPTVLRHTSYPYYTPYHTIRTYIAHLNQRIAYCTFPRFVYLHSRPSCRLTARIVNVASVLAW